MQIQSLEKRIHHVTGTPCVYSELMAFHHILLLESYYQKDVIPCYILKNVMSCREARYGHDGTFDVSMAHD